MRAMDQSPEEAAQVSARLPGSPVQRLLHNKLLDRLDSLRNEIEIVSPEDLKTKQGNIAELRRVLGILHQGDGPSLKETYA